MRSDLKNLTTTVDSIAKDQALGAERRANMQRSADSIFLRLDAHDRELDDLRRWRDRADGAMVLARWALGASLISLTAVVLQVVAPGERPLRGRRGDDRAAPVDPGPAAAGAGGPTIRSWATPEWRACKGGDCEPQ
jgi:hypothetical protein